MDDHRIQPPVGDGGPLSGPQIPSRLVERPKARYLWFGGFTAFGVLLLVLGVLPVGPPGEQSVSLMMLGIGVSMLALGAVALRWGIVADQQGVTITNTRRRTIAWTELEDVLLVKVESTIDLGIHYLVFLTRAGDQIRPAAPTGWNRPGRTLPRLQRDLLAMRDRYASGATEAAVESPAG